LSTVRASEITSAGAVFPTDGPCRRASHPADDTDGEASLSASQTRAGGVDGARGAFTILLGESASRRAGPPSAAPRRKIAEDRPPPGHLLAASLALWVDPLN